MERATAAPSSVFHVLRASVRLFRQRAFVSLSLGAAVLLSLIAVCCGIGAISAPWFMAELLAVQLAEAGGRRVPRTTGWIAASSVLLAAVLLVASSAWLTTLAFDTQVHSDTAGSVLATLPQVTGFVIAFVTTLIALAAVIPLFYVPTILLDRGGNVGGALLESVRLVIDGGFRRHFAISLTSHVIQVLPLLLAVAVGAGLFGWPAVPTAVLSASPLLALSLPIGQGMFVAAYSEVRSSITNPRRTRAAGRPPRWLVIAMVVCVLTPIASLFAFGGSLVRPSHLTPGKATGGMLIGEIDLTTRPTGHIFPTDTTLEINATRKKVRVTAGDGGGAGTLPLYSTRSLQRVRVFRSGEAIQIEITQGKQTFTTRVDSAGVRLDDDLRARFSDRAPLWAIAFMLGTLLLALALLGPPVYQLALVRRMYTLVGEQRPPTPQIQLRRRQAVAHGRVACAVLAPAIVATLYWAVRAVLGV